MQTFVRLLDKVVVVVVRKNNNRDWQTLMIIKLFKIKVYNAFMLCRGCDEELYAPGGLRMYGGPPDESVSFFFAIK